MYTTRVHNYSIFRKGVIIIFIDHVSSGSDCSAGIDGAGASIVSATDRARRRWGMPK